MATSFKTRKALGKRYAKDPALTLEQDKLKYQYSLAPGRESLAQQKAAEAERMRFNREQAATQSAQYQQGLNAQNEAQDAQANSAMVSTIGNTALTAGAIRGNMVAKSGQPFWGNWGGGSTPTSPTNFYADVAGGAPSAAPQAPAGQGFNAPTVPSGVPMGGAVNWGAGVQGPQPFTGSVPINADAAMYDMFPSAASGVGTGAVAGGLGAANATGIGGAVSLQTGAPATIGGATGGLGAGTGMSTLASAGWGLAAALPSIYGSYAHPKEYNVGYAAQENAYKSGYLLNPNGDRVSFANQAELDAGYGRWKQGIADLVKQEESRQEAMRNNNNQPISPLEAFDRQASGGSVIDSIFGGR